MDINNFVKTGDKEYTRVPLDKVWFLVIDCYEEPNWYSAKNIKQLAEIMQIAKNDCMVFAVWHGQWKTNLFLMPIDYLQEKLSLPNDYSVK